MATPTRIPPHVNASHKRTHSAETPRAQNSTQAVGTSLSNANDSLKVLKSTTFAASFSDRKSVVTPLNPPPAKLTEKHVTPNILGVIQLAKSGTWRAALRLVDQLSTKMKSSAPPHVLLQLSELKIFVSFKLRLFKSASEEFSRLGNLDDMQYQFESYPSTYPGLNGSFVPFSLRILKAEIDYHQGKPSSKVDSLYALLSMCQIEIEKSLEKEHSNISGLNITEIDELLGGTLPLPNFLNTKKQEWSEDPNLFLADTSSWRMRYNWVSLQLISHFIQTKEYILAIPMMQKLLDRYPEDCALLSAAARLFIQIGIIPKAEELIERVKKLDTSSNVEIKTLIEMNSGCLAAANGNYSEACERFTSVLTNQPGNQTAANNKAVCMVYMCQLTKAVHLLEDFIAQDPASNLCESIVQNLTCLYDVQSSAGAEKKAHLMKLVAQYGSDSFDHTVLKRN